MGKNVLITGATGGIGSAISKKFIDEGFEVYSLDLVSKDFGDKFHNFVCDVTSKEELENVKNQIGDVKFSHIITLAGRALEDEWKDFALISFDSIYNSIKLNLAGHLLTIRTFMSSFDSENTTNSVVLISSINAYGGFGLPVYSSAKAGLIGFCKSVHSQLKEKGIRINTICPGTIVTDATLTEPKDFSALLKTTKLGRFMTKEEVADLAYELCEKSNQTGQVVNIDAGQNEVVNGK